MEGRIRKCRGSWPVLLTRVVDFLTSADAGHRHLQETLECLLFPSSGLMFPALR